MKKFFNLQNFVLFCMLALAAGCMKDRYLTKQHYTFYAPKYQTTAEVRAGIRSNAPKPIEQPGKMFILGNYIFLNEVDKGIHVIDNSNPSAPVNKAFIDIPGNMDLAVSGHTLYADLYTDLVTLDISDPSNVVVKRIIDDVFPHRVYNSDFHYDSTHIITAWEKRDTILTTEEINRGDLRSRYLLVSYANNSTSGGAVPTFNAASGIAGSMARFALLNNYLYTVGSTDLNAFNVSNPENPQWVSSHLSVGSQIETIFPFQDKLFMGTGIGVLIYSVSTPDKPMKMGQFNHVTSCDPVIAENDVAYATLRTGNSCTRGVNSLDVLSTANILNPQLIKSYPMVNPHGLCKEGNLLFVCDGTAGLSVFDARNPSALVLKEQVKGLDAYDVIATQGVAIVSAKDGIYQYSYNGASLTLLSKLNLEK